MTVQRFTSKVSSLAIQKRHKDAEVFAKVTNGLIEGHAEHSLDHHLMRQANAECESTIGYLLQRARLSRQHRRVTRVSGNNCGAQTNLRHFTRNHRERGERVEAKDLRHPVGPESRISEKSSVFNSLVDGFGLAKDSNFHDDSWCLLS
ncbi:unannotated protein [freshwater metagenome]|uniref:Unannotated protein n=1 Tax=freshwater metagenome TaxID=449393 RepID=A0A6J6NTS3_9ZZZZ